MHDRNRTDVPAGDLVEDVDPCISEECSCDAEKLSPTVAQLLPVHRCIQPIFFKDTPQVDFGECLDNPVIGRVAVGV